MWHKLALNPQALDNLYETVPELDCVELFTINLNREGAKIQVRFDLQKFPDYPSARWQDRFNTVQIQLSFFEVTNFKAIGWHTIMKVKIGIKKDHETLIVVIFNSEIDLNFSFLSKNFRIENVSAYQNDCL